MSLTRILAASFAVCVLTACGGGSPGKSDVQGAVERLAKEQSMMFGGDTPIVKDTKCTESGNDAYVCVTALATSSDPDAHAVTVKMTKLSGQWTAQIANVLQ